MRSRKWARRRARQADLAWARWNGRLSGFPRMLADKYLDFARDITRNLLIYGDVAVSIDSIPLRARVVQMRELFCSFTIPAEEVARV